MANWTRIAPTGYANKSKSPSADATEMDIRITKAVNGDEGGAWAGPITLTNLTTDGTQTLAAAGDTTPFLASAITPTTRKLISRHRASATIYVRVYATLSGGFEGSERVVGASWNGSAWVRDTTTDDVTMHFFGNDGQYIIRHKAAASGTFTTWDTYLNVSTNNNLLLGSNAPNELDPKNLVKAWAVVTTDGAGAKIVLDGYGFPFVSPVAFGSNYLEFTMNNAMVSTNFAVIATDMLAVNAAHRWTFKCHAQTTTTFRVYAFDEGDASNVNNAWDPSTTQLAFGLMVMGRQA